MRLSKSILTIVAFTSATHFCSVLIAIWRDLPDFEPNQPLFLVGSSSYDMDANHLGVNLGEFRDENLVVRTVLNKWNLTKGRHPSIKGAVLNVPTMKPEEKSKPVQACPLSLQIEVVESEPTFVNHNVQSPEQTLEYPGSWAKSQKC